MTLKAARFLPFVMFKWNGNHEQTNYNGRASYRACRIEAGRKCGFFYLSAWLERGEKEYPAIYVSDGSIMLTLWAIKEEPSIQFNRRKNIGLHHVAFNVENEDDLNMLHKRLADNGTKIEFAPERLGQGPARHMMCYEPSGIRVEFIWMGK